MSDLHEHHGLRLGSIGKTPLYVEPGFFFLCAMFVLISLNDGQPMRVALLWIPILFVSTIVHELGHAAMIALLGFGRSVVALGTYGGVTMNDSRRRPWQQILISIAGPILGAAFGYLCQRLSYLPFAYNDAMFSELLPRAAMANYAWAIFNLFPIYPLDGGKVLRSLTAMFLSNSRSFAVTCWVSMILSALLLVGALIGHQMWMVVIAASLLYENFKLWSHYRSSGFTE